MCFSNRHRCALAGLLLTLMLGLSSPASAQDRPTTAQIAADLAADQAGANTAPIDDAFLQRHEARRQALLAKGTAHPVDRERVRTAPAPAVLRDGTLVFTVDNTYDDSDASPGDGVCATSFNDCTLRAALMEADATPNTTPVRVEFDISFGPGWDPGTGLARIQIGPGGSAGLFAIYQPNLTVDGLTQPGASCGNLTGGTRHDLRVILDGSLLPDLGLPGEYGILATDESPGFTVRGLVVQNFGSYGIIVDGAGSLVECNYVGTTSNGVAARPTGTFGGRAGIIVGSGDPSPGSTVVRNNLVSGNDGIGVLIERDRTEIRDNLIGTDAAGGFALGNGQSGIEVYAADVVIDGNVISANQTGVVLGTSEPSSFRPSTSATRTRLTDNLIGLSRSGLGTSLSGLGNVSFGVLVWSLPGGFSVGSPSDNDIGLPGAGNTISNNGGGITILSSDDNRIRGNTIGLNAFGNAALNSSQGILLAGDDVNGTVDDTIIDGNVIAGNTGYGIFLSKTTASLVEGNVIGLNAVGTTRPNGLGGIILYKGSDGATIRDNTVSGNGTAGGDGVGILLDGREEIVTNTLIQDNRVGTTEAGTSARPNTQSGLALVAASGVTVRGNTLSGNTDAGLYLENAVTVTVEDNLIGTNTAGADLGNGISGVRCRSATGVRIGGVGLSGGAEGTNTIAFNGSRDGSRDGIFLQPACQDVAILGNAVHSNRGLGIDLAPNGVNPNDNLDADSGANAKTNYPVITDVTLPDLVGFPSTVSFELDALPNQEYRVEAFRSTVADPSGFGEGRTFIGATFVTTDGSGRTTGAVSGAPGLLSSGDWVTTTATPTRVAFGVRRYDGTSEFSEAALAGTSGSPFAVTITPTNPTGSPVVLARGERVLFDITFDVGPGGTQFFSYRTEAVLPNGSTTGALIGPNNVVAPTPPSSVALSFSQRVPANAALGSYTYRVVAINLFGTVLGSDSFEAEIVPAAATGGDQDDDRWIAFAADGSPLIAGLVHDFRAAADGESSPDAETNQANTLPDAVTLEAPYPNPAHAEATVGFALPEAAEVRLAVYDVLGREVARLLHGEVEPGQHEVRFDGTDLPSGVYVVRLVVGSIVQTQRVTLMR